jgi:2-methylisocitrate lyase-like PEP mutase family enzyme
MAAGRCPYRRLPARAPTLAWAIGSNVRSAGVRRISLATSLYRIAMTGLVEAAREVKDKGTFGYIDRSIPTPDLAAFMQG